MQDAVTEFLNRVVAGLRTMLAGPELRRIPIRVERQRSNLRTFHGF